MIDPIRPFKPMIEDNPASGWPDHYHRFLFPGLHGIWASSGRTRSAGAFGKKDGT